MLFCFDKINTFSIFASTKIFINTISKNLTDMKKVYLSLVAVALFGTFALSSCKSGNTANADSAAAVEAPAPAPVDSSAVATPDSAASTDSAAVK
ncbi:MAG TPA: hypothetical protein VHO90_04195 [Bacteroidales bacterium]|nr:hypothetical protein [Bacteroidales bacterium]